MRKTLSLMLFVGLGSVMAQVQGGHETVQDAIRFERQKDAAAARQVRIEAARSSADRTAGTNSPAKNNRATHPNGKKAGSASRTDKPSEPKQ